MSDLKIIEDRVYGRAHPRKQYAHFLDSLPADGALCKTGGLNRL